MVNIHGKQIPATRGRTAARINGSMISCRRLRAMIRPLAVHANLKDVFY
jgi:hypothetical protein